MMAPERAEQAMLGAIFVIGIVAEGLFPAGEGAAAVLIADLPAANVAAEKGDIASRGDERFQVIAHRTGPVFVVADREHQFIGLEQFRTKLQVVVDREIERVAVLLGPGDEGMFPGGELTDLGSLEGDAAALHLIAALVGVDTIAAVAGVGVVGVGIELEQDTRIAAGSSGP